MSRRFLFLGAVLVLLIAVASWRSFTGSETHTGAYLQTQIEIGGVTLTADIADTEALRELGLSGRESLREDEAMLFVFQEDGEHAFWMKEMLFPIDMIWLSADKKVVHIAKRATPESFPSSFSPGAPTRYVIEVPAGFTDRHAVAVGSVAAWK